MYAISKAVFLGAFVLTSIERVSADTPSSAGMCVSISDQSARGKCFENYIRESKGMAVKVFKDPSSAQFRSVFVSEFDKAGAAGKGWVVCGEVTVRTRSGRMLAMR